MRLLYAYAPKEFTLQTQTNFKAEPYKWKEIARRKCQQTYSQLDIMDSESFYRVGNW